MGKHQSHVGGPSSPGLTLGVLAISKCSSRSMNPRSSVLLAEAQGPAFKQKNWEVVMEDSSVGPALCSRLVPPAAVAAWTAAQWAAQVPCNALQNVGQQALGWVHSGCVHADTSKHQQAGASPSL